MLNGSVGYDAKNFFSQGKQKTELLKCAGNHNTLEVSEEASENQASNAKATEWHESILLPALQCQVLAQYLH